METKPRWIILIPLVIVSVIFMPWESAHPSYEYQYGFQIHYTFKQFGFLFNPPADAVPGILSLAFEWVIFASAIYWFSLLRELHSIQSRIALISSVLLVSAAAVILVPWGHTDPESARTVFDEYDLLWQPHFQPIMLEFVLLEVLAVIGLAILATKRLIHKAGDSEELVPFDSLSLNP